MLEAFKCSCLTMIQQIGVGSEAGRSFELGWDETGDAVVSGSVDEVDLRVTRNGRDDEIDATKAIAKTYLVVIVDSQNLIP